MTYSTLDDLRVERNKRLAAYDYYFYTDVAEQTSDVKLESIKVYRQFLRDIPAQYESDATDIEIEWPPTPSSAVV